MSQVLWGAMQVHLLPPSMTAVQRSKGCYEDRVTATRHLEMKMGEPGKQPSRGGSYGIEGKGKSCMGFTSQNIKDTGPLSRMQRSWIHLMH